MECLPCPVPLVRLSAPPATTSRCAAITKPSTGGKIAWFPDHIKGGARTKVLEGLLKRALITPDGDAWVVAAEGYDALGLPRPGALPPTIKLDDPELEADVASAEAS